MGRRHPQKASSPPGAVAQTGVRSIAGVVLISLSALPLAGAAKPLLVGLPEYTYAAAYLFGDAPTDVIIFDHNFVDPQRGGILDKEWDDLGGIRLAAYADPLGTFWVNADAGGFIQEYDGKRIIGGVAQLTYRTTLRKQSETDVFSYNFSALDLQIADYGGPLDRDLTASLSWAISFRLDPNDSTTTTPWSNMYADITDRAPFTAPPTVSGTYSPSYIYNINGSNYTFDAGPLSVDIDLGRFENFDVGDERTFIATIVATAKNRYGETYATAHLRDPLSGVGASITGVDIPTPVPVPAALPLFLGGLLWLAGRIKVLDRRSGPAC